MLCTYALPAFDDDHSFRCPLEWDRIAFHLHVDVGINVHLNVGIGIEFGRSWRQRAGWMLPSPSTPYRTSGTPFEGSGATWW